MNLKTRRTFKHHPVHAYPQVTFTIKMYLASSSQTREMKIELQESWKSALTDIQFLLISNIGFQLGRHFLKVKAFFFLR